VERLDAQKIDLLRRWADGLAGDERDELRAAARAILLLIEELERVHVELWNAKGLHEPPSEAAERPSVGSVLASRLRGVRGSTGELPLG
jgi:hypothetical protein